MVSKMVSSSLYGRAECNENPHDRIFTSLGDLPTRNIGINLQGKVRVGDDALLRSICWIGEASGG